MRIYTEHTRFTRKIRKKWPKHSAWRIFCFQFVQNANKSCFFSNLIEHWSHKWNCILFIVSKDFKPTISSSSCWTKSDLFNKSQTLLYKLVESQHKLFFSRVKMFFPTYLFENLRCFPDFIIILQTRQKVCSVDTMGYEMDTIYKNIQCEWSKNIEQW